MSVSPIIIIILSQQNCQSLDTVNSNTNLHWVGLISVIIPKRDKYISLTDMPNKRAKEIGMERCLLE